MMDDAAAKPAPTPDRAELQARLQALLLELAELRGPQVPEAQRLARAQLKAWQAQRLARTHEALMRQPRYELAARFFLEDLYGPKDAARRDADLARVLPKLLKLLPRAALLTLVDAMRMDVLSESLDAQMSGLLTSGPARGGPSAGMDLDEERYAQAYRACGREAERREQIDLVLRIGRSLDELTRLPMLSTTLSLMKGPAHRAGLGELHDFLHRGFHAFARMRGSEAFLQAIVQRERELMLSWLQPPPP